MENNFIENLVNQLGSISEKIKEKNPEEHKEISKALKQLDSKFTELNNLTEQLKDIQSKL